MNREKHIKKARRRLIRAEHRADLARDCLVHLSTRLDDAGESLEKAVNPLFQEFKKFIMKGNVLDLAVGVIMATAFGKITSTLVNNVIMPLVGVLLGGVDFSTLQVTLIGLSGAEIPLQYGLFIQAIVDFLVIALSVFLLVKVLTARRKKVAAAPPAPTKDQQLLAEIRDLLRAQAESTGDKYTEDK